MDVFLVNESSKLTDLDAFNIAWALNYQARFHFGRVGWRSDVRCTFVPGGGNARIPAGGSILHMLDTSDQPGALGYHDEDGNEVPYGRIFVATSISDGDEPSEVASHELLELAADPNVNLSAINPQENRLYAVEVGDPCQGNGYDVGAPEGRTTGIIVADFAKPNYFDPNTHTSASTTFRGSLKGPFTLGSQGYYSYIDLNNPGQGWQQKVGGEYKGAPPVDSDDRVARRA